MTRAVILHRHGGPEELVVGDVELAEPGPAELLVRQTAIGVNFHDIYVRTGLYDTLELPGIPGLDAAAVVETVGAGVTRFKPGDRVGYVLPSYGGYAEARVLPADAAIKLPDFLDDVQAAGSLMKALTVCMLLRRIHKVSAGDTILVHAAAGGVGQLLCSWASTMGATVIGTVGDRAKVKIATAAGCDHTILYREEDFVARVREITGGQGVAVAYDSVGQDTFSGSVQSLGFLGHLVNYGQSSGPVGPIAPSLLATRSLSLSRPILFHCLRTAEMIEAMASETFEAFRGGLIKPVESLTLGLSEAAEAHRLLEARKSPGSIVLIP